MAEGKETSTPAQAESDLYFGPFRLERAKRLWRGEHLVEVRPRPLVVLRYLAERPGRLVTSDELIKRLWPGIYVTRTVLRVCVRELRQALNEDPVTPQFIETVVRQGYRFIALLTTAPSVVSGQLSVVSSDKEEPKPSQLGAENWQLTTPFVGREQELARLHAAFARAQRGKRQVVFLIGEPGIGKTTLMERFLTQLRQGAGEGEREIRPLSPHISSFQSHAPRLWIGRGQCIEHYGPGEAYLPLLEALGQLCEGPSGEQVIAVLRRSAPMWLGQLSGLLEAREREALHRQLQGSSRDRMLRELAEALEVVATDTVLVLVLEDLHWSDTATLETIAYLAQRQRPVRLLVIGTYRPVETVVNKHPLRNLVRELYGRGQCEEVALELLTEAEVEEYLRQRLGQSAALTELNQLIYQRTNGNALFVVSFVDSLLQQRLLVEADGQVQLQADRVTLKRLVPHSLQQAILGQIERLAVDEQQLLKVASVGGMTFTAAEVAGVLGRALEEVEEKYDHLATQEGVLAIAGIAEGLDEAVTARYEFRHGLYQQVLYEQLGQGRRVRLHRQLGEWKEAHYGERATEIASALAVHFTEGREYGKAVQYHYQAGKVVLGRSAYSEALAHCQQGLTLLTELPDAPERQRQELAIRMILSAALTATEGFGAEELVQNLIRARELCQVLNDDASLVSVLVGLGRFHNMRADRAATQELMDEERRLVERLHEPTLAIQLHTQLGTGNVLRGAHRRAQEHYAQVLEIYDPKRHRDLTLRFGLDPAVLAGVFSGWSLWLAGWPDQARARMQQGLSWAQELSLPFSLALALVAAAHIQVWCGDLEAAEKLAEEGVRLSREHGVVLYTVLGELIQACVHVLNREPMGGLSTLTEGLSLYRGFGALYSLPVYLSFVAHAYLQLGRVEEGLATVAEALRMTETNLDVFWEAELYRLKGELMLSQSRVQSLASSVKKSGKSKVKSGKLQVPSTQLLTPSTQAEAEACFHKAIEIAKQQEAKSLELRAAMSLSRLWQQQGKRKEARTLLRDIYGWFTEGFDTKDLREAKALLDALGA